MIRLREWVTFSSEKVSFDFTSKEGYELCNFNACMNWSVNCSLLDNSIEMATIRCSVLGKRKKSGSNIREKYPIYLVTNGKENWIWDWGLFLELEIETEPIGYIGLFLFFFFERIDFIMLIFNTLLHFLYLQCKCFLSKFVSLGVYYFG